MNIEYFFLKRSALQFKQDLIDIDDSLDLLSPEEAIVIISYMDSIKFKMKPIKDKLSKKLMRNEE